MKKITTVKFKTNGKGYYFDPANVFVKVGDKVIVDTDNGMAFGTIAEGVRMVEDSEIETPLKKVIRVATDKDMQRIEENHKKEKDALSVCEEEIAKLKLEMSLVNVEYSFDCTKITFFFTAEGRVDFRELVKNLAARFHTRIELRQIGVRDEARMLGGLGICGQPFCCKRFLDNFQSVSIKMAKEQGLPINPANISGTCGRLMCCLQYEQNSYEYLAKITPSVGSVVKTGEGLGTVTDVNLISGNIMVKLNDSEAAPMKYHRDNVKLISRKKLKKNEEKVEN